MVKVTSTLQGCSAALPLWGMTLLGGNWKPL